MLPSSLDGGGGVTGVIGVGGVLEGRLFPDEGAEIGGGRGGGAERSSFFLDQHIQ